MKYEQFLADVGKTRDEVKGMGRTLSRVKSVLSAAHDLVGKNERLEKENAELRDELDDWKGNAEGFQPDAYMKLPVDADGEPIRIGDTVYTRDAEEYTVRGIYALAGEYSISVVPLGGTCFLPMEPEGLTHRTTDSADSWEKLEEDARKTSCEYACAPLDASGFATCDGCRFGFEKCGPCHIEKALDVLKRAKKLAGVEDAEEASDD